MAMARDNSVSALSRSSDGEYLFVGSYGKLIALSPNNLVKAFGRDDLQYYARGVKVSADGSWVAAAMPKVGESVRRWKLGADGLTDLPNLAGMGRVPIAAPKGAVAAATIKSIPENRTEFDDVAFSPDGKLLAACGNDVDRQAGKRVARFTVWETETGRLVATTVRAGARFTSLSFGHDESNLYVGGGDDEARNGLESGGEVLFLDALTGELRGVLHGHTQPVIQLVPLPNSRKFVTTGLDGRVLIWNKIEKSAQRR
jgi:dipeptidyl aminopeptidase/acylaminoacyl peptidase